MKYLQGIFCLVFVVHQINAISSGSQTAITLDPICPAGYEHEVNSNQCFSVSDCQSSVSGTSCPDGATLDLEKLKCWRMDCPDRILPRCKQVCVHETGCSSGDVCSSPDCSGCDIVQIQSTCRTVCGDEHQTTDVDYLECPKGETLCMDSKRCSLNCKEIKENFFCPKGLKFCPRTQTCSSSCTKTGKKTSCPKGFTFCLATDTCQNQCNEDPLTHQNLKECPFGTTFCLETQTCRTECPDFTSGKALTTMTCPEGQTFCIESGFCSEKCPSSEVICPHPLTFCASKGFCSAECNSGSAEVRTCGPQEVFCWTSLTCQKDCNSPKKKRQAEMTCPEGMEFCLDTATCSKTCTLDETIHRECPTGQIFCLDSGKCQSTCSLHNLEKQDLLSTCPGSLVLCLDTGECAESCSPDRPKPDGTSDCPVGFVFCLEKGHCSESCDDNTSNIVKRDTSISCPEGLIYCLKTDTCQTECNDTNYSSTLVEVASECPDGKLFCLETGECSDSCPEMDSIKNFNVVKIDGELTSSNESQLTTCSSGLMFCIETMSCESTCGNFIINSKLDDKMLNSPLVLCKDNEIFCFNLQRCAKDCLATNETSKFHVVAEDETSVGCPVGEMFCLDTGSCQKSCGVEKGDDNHTNFFVVNHNDGSDPTTGCPEGEVFCLKTQTCSKNCIEVNIPNIENINIIEPCHHGKVFCLKTQTCEVECDQPFEQDGINCPEGTIFCISSNTCEENCQSREPHRIQSISCPDGFTYCISSGECSIDCDQSFIPSDRERKHQLSDMRKAQTCPEGKVFCLPINACLSSDDCGKFDISSSNETCRNDCPLNLPTSNYSTCYSDDHCQIDFGQGLDPNATCCPDVVGHRKCFSNKTLDDGSVLQKVCDTFSSAWFSELADGNSTCLNDPSECHKGTICCNGICYGDPSDQVRVDGDGGPCRNNEGFCETNNQCYSVTDFGKFCYTIYAGVLMSSEGANDLEVKLSLDKIIGKNESECWVISDIVTSDELLIEKGAGLEQWTTPYKSQIFCTWTNSTRIKFSFKELPHHGLIEDSYLEVHRFANPNEKKRIMVMNMPILSPPLTLLENDISLDKSLLPVMVPHDFRVHRNKTNAIDIKQVLMGMKNLGFYRFDLSDTGLYQCLKSIIHSPQEQVGVNLIPGGATPFIGDAAQSSSWTKTNISKCYTSFESNNMMDIESGGDNSFVVVPCLEDCLEKFTDLSETFQSTRFGGSYKITVVDKVESSGVQKNYPNARLILPSHTPPRVSYENYQDGISCGELASYYFTNQPNDPDCKNCGIIILNAVSGNLGYWEIFTNNTNGFEQVDSSFPVRSMLRPCLQSIGITYRGTILNDNCLANCSQTFQVEAKVCPPDGRLRFTKNTDNPAWSAVESFAAKVLFLAYDYDQYELSQPLTQLNLPGCYNSTMNPNQNGISTDMAVFYLEMQDCDGAVVCSSSDVKTVDHCNICGGDSIDCEQCSGNNPGQTCCTSSSPLTTCKMYGTNETEVMSVLKGSTLDCHSRPVGIREAGVNQCGNSCEEPHKYGVDSCGRCVKRQNSTAVNSTFCALQCTGKNCNNKAVLQDFYVLPNVVDIVLSPSIANFRLAGSKLEIGKYSSAICSLGYQSQSIGVSGASFQGDGSISVYVNNPTIGYYDVTCQLILSSDNTTIMTLSTMTSFGVSIVNSQTINITSAVVKEVSTNVYTVTISVDDASGLKSFTSGLTCFYRLKNDTTVGDVFPTSATLSSNNILCGKGISIPGNVYQIGALFVSDNKAVSKIGLSTAVVEVISSSPGIVSSILSLGSELQLTFDVNIQGPQDCDGIFDADSMALIGGSASCTIGANTLRVLSNNFKTIPTSGKSIHFKSGNSILVAGAMTGYAQEVPGGLKVEIHPANDEAESNPFTMSSQSQFCYNSTVCFVVQFVSLLCPSSGSGSGGLFFNASNELGEVVWNGSIPDPEGNFSSQNVCITNKLDSGFYSISVSTNCEKEKNFFDTITFSIASPCTPFVIDIGQNYKIVNPEAGLTMVANVINCRPSNTNKAYKMVWGEANGKFHQDLSRKDTRILKLDPKSLEGDTVYNFTITVIAEETTRTNLTSKKALSVQRAEALAKTNGSQTTFHGEFSLYEADYYDDYEGDLSLDDHPDYELSGGGGPNYQGGYWDGQNKPNTFGNFTRGVIKQGPRRKQSHGTPLGDGFNVTGNLTRGMKQLPRHGPHDIRDGLNLTGNLTKGIKKQFGRNTSSQGSRTNYPDFNPGEERGRKKMTPGGQATTLDPKSISGNRHGGNIGGRGREQTGGSASAGNETNYNQKEENGSHRNKFGKKDNNFDQSQTPLFDPGNSSAGNTSSRGYLDQTQHPEGNGGRGSRPSKNKHWGQTSSTEGSEGTDFEGSGSSENDTLTTQRSLGSNGLTLNMDSQNSSQTFGGGGREPTSGKRQGGFGFGGKNGGNKFGKKDDNLGQSQTPQSDPAGNTPANGYLDQSQYPQGSGGRGSRPSKNKNRGQTSSTVGSESSDFDGSGSSELASSSEDETSSTQRFQDSSNGLTPSTDTQDSSQTSGLGGGEPTTGKRQGGFGGGFGFGGKNGGNKPGRGGKQSGNGLGSALNNMRNDLSNQSHDFWGQPTPQQSSVTTDSNGATGPGPSSSEETSSFSTGQDTSLPQQSNPGPDQTTTNQSDTGATTNINLATSSTPSTEQSSSDQTSSVVVTQGSTTTSPISQSTPQTPVIDLSGTISQVSGAVTQSTRTMGSLGSSIGQAANNVFGSIGQGQFGFGGSNGGFGQGRATPGSPGSRGENNNKRNRGKRQARNLDDSRNLERVVRSSVQDYFTDYFDSETEECEIQDDLTGNLAEIATAYIIVDVLSKGVSANVIPSELDIGSDGTLRLDATTSEDLDNKLGPLQFLWSCSQNDSSCLTLSTRNGSGISVEESVGIRAITQPVLTVPKGSLPPGLYNFTVEVSKGVQSALATTSVRILSSNLAPDIQLLAFKNNVNPADQLTLRGLIVTYEASTLQWESVKEEGINYADLSSIGAVSITPVSFPSPVSNIRFDLVLPAMFLQSSSTYKFRLTGTGLVNNGVTKQVVTVKTRPGPFNGKFNVSPVSGQALTTEFHIHGNWQQLPSDETDLTYKFGYRKASSSQVNLLALFVVSKDDPFINVKVHVPFVGEDLVITAAVCNEFGACFSSESDTIQVTMPPDDIKVTLKQVALEAATMITQKDPFGAVSLTRSIVTTIFSSGFWSTYHTPVCALQFRIFIKAATTLREQLDNTKSSANDVLMLLNEFTSSECFNIVDDSIAEDRKQATNLASVLNNDVVSVLKQAEAKGASNTPTALPNRVKRQTTSSSTNCSAIKNYLSKSELETLMKVGEQNILSLNSSSASEVEVFLESLHSHISTEMCSRASMYSPPETLSSNTATAAMGSFSPQPTVGNIRLDIPLPPNTTNGSLPLTRPPHSMSISDDALNQLLNQLECCGTCNSLSLYGVLLNKDYISLLANSSDTNSPVLISPIMSVRLYNSRTCDEITSENVTMPENGIKMKMQVPTMFKAGNGTDRLTSMGTRAKRQTQSGTVSTSGSNGMQMKCLVFYNNAWNSDLCLTSSITLSSDGQSATVNCQCSVTGYIAVGLVNANNQVTYMQELYKFQKNVQFTINANSSLCINDKQNFLSSMRAQLAKFLNTDPYNFLSIDCTAGSIIINFELVASDDVTAVQLSDAYNELVVYLQNGFLQLHDQNGNMMSVLPQCIDTCQTNRQGDVVAIVIGVICLLVVLSLILCIICAVCIKKKKRLEKHSFIMPVRFGNSQVVIPPNYRDIPYADTLEGSDLQRLRSNQGVRSIMLLEEEHFDRHGVPIPAKYQAPSKDQLTRAVTEEMLRKIARMEDDSNRARWAE